MKKILLFAALFVMVFQSCKNDDDDAQAAENILAKTVTKEDDDSDSTVTEYSYDSQNRLIGESSKEGDDTYLRTLTRDNEGRVTKQTDTETSPGTASDISIIDFFYQSASGPTVKNGIEVFSLFGDDIRDSIAFTYAGNRVSRTSHLWTVPSIPAFPATEVEYWEYQYDSRGNMNRAAYYVDTTSDLSGTTLLATLEFQYDDKVNPLYRADDALVEEVLNQYISPNNPTRLDILFPGEPVQTITITYEYRSDGRPTKSTQSISGSSPAITTYTYRR